MLNWDFDPQDFELMPGDLHRITELAECSFNHVYKWYMGGYYQCKSANEVLLMASLLVTFNTIFMKGAKKSRTGALVIQNGLLDNYFDLIEERIVIPVDAPEIASDNYPRPKEGMNRFRLIGKTIYGLNCGFAELESMRRLAKWKRTTKGIQEKNPLWFASAQSLRSLFLAITRTGRRTSFVHSWPYWCTILH